MSVQDGTRLGVGAQARRFMHQRARVQRRVVVGTARDEFNQPVQAGPMFVYDALPVRMGGIVAVRDRDGARDVQALTVELLAPGDADIRVGDSFHDVTDRRGRVIGVGPFEVLAVGVVAAPRGGGSFTATRCRVVK